MRKPISSLLARLVNGTASTCTCLTKSPDVLEHDPNCQYRLLTKAADAVPKAVDPIPMVLYCPKCGVQHCDSPNPRSGWTNPPHCSHRCESCGAVWRPADVPTIGVATIQTEGKDDSWRPGDKGEAAPAQASDEKSEAFNSARTASVLKALVRESEELFTHWLYWVNGQAGDTPPVDKTRALLASVGETLGKGARASSLKEALFELREQYALQDKPEFKADLESLRETVRVYEGEIKALREASQAQQTEIEALRREHARWQSDEQRALEQIGKLSTDLESAKRELEVMRQENIELFARIRAAGDGLVLVRTAVASMPHWALSTRAKAQLLKLCAAAERALSARTPVVAQEPARAPNGATAETPLTEVAKDSGKRRRKRTSKKTTSA